MASDAVVNLVVNAADAETDVQVQLNRIVNQAERNAPPVVLNVTIDQRQVTNNINQINNGLTSINNNAGDASDGTSRLGSAFASMGGAALSAVTAGARIGVIGSLAATSLPAVAGLATALANIAPAATAGVAAFATIKLATATLKVGLIGVSDALGQVFAAKPDAEALAEAMERLSPNARAFVKELQSMRPALESIRTGTQDRIFDNLDTSLGRLADEVLPKARTAAFSFADSFNAMARNAAAGATSISEQGVLGSALKSSTRAFANLERIPGQVLVSIIRLANAGGPLLNRITARIAEIATSVSTRLATAQQNGGLQKAVDQAAKTLQQLGRIAGNVMGALGNIFETASAAGGGLFGSLEKVTQALEDLTATTGFKETLTALIETGQTLLTNVLPLLTQAFQVLAPVITILAPPIQQIIELLGRELEPVIKLLGPILEIAATAFGNLLIALSPLITLAGTLIQAILPVLTPLFEALNEIIIALTPIITLLAEELAVALVPVIEALIPIITRLAEFIADVVIAIAPLVEELVPLAVDLFARWAPVVTTLFEKLEPLIDAILDLATFLVEKLVEALIKVIDWVKDLAATYEELAGKTIDTILLPALESIVDFLNGDHKKAWDGAKQVAVTAGIGIATNLRETLASARSSLIQLSVEAFVRVGSLMERLVGLFENGGEGIRRVITRLMLDAVGRIENTLGAFFQAGQRLMLSLAAGILSKVADVVNAVSSAASQARDLLPFSPAKKGPFSGRGYPLYSGRALMEAFAQGITDRSGMVSDALQSSFSTPALATGVTGTTQSTGTFGGLVSGTLFGSTTTPSVAVYIGDELITDRIRTVVTDENAARDRQASQGVRL